MIMAKKIFVENSAKCQLRKTFNCSVMMVWKALNFQSDSKLARKIRFVALKQYNGVPNYPLVQFDTTHETSAGTMTQTFGDRVKLVVCKDDASAVVYIDGEVDRKVPHLEIPELMNMQQELTLRAAAL